MLEVLAGRITLAQAAAEAGVSTTSISNWKRQFLAAAREGLAAGSPPSEAGQLAALQAERERLLEQLRDAAVLARVWRVSAPARQDADSGPVTRQHRNRMRITNFRHEWGKYRARAW